jgi:hypothetical protein
MPTQIEVPGQGIIEFPDGMGDDEIKSVLRSKFPPTAPTAPPVPFDGGGKVWERGPSTTAGGPPAQLASARETFAAISQARQDETAMNTEKLPRIAGVDESAVKPLEVAAVNAIPGAALASAVIGDDEAVQVGREVINLGVGLGDFMTAPEGVVAVGAGAVAPVATAGAFTVDMLKNLGQGVAQAYKTWPQMTRTQKFQAVTQLGGAGLMAFALGKHTYQGTRAKVDPAYGVAKMLNDAEPKVWKAEPKPIVEEVKPKQEPPPVPNQVAVAVELAKPVAPLTAAVVEKQVAPSDAKVEAVIEPTPVAEPEVLTQPLVTESASKSVIRAGDVSLPVKGKLKPNTIYVWGNDWSGSSAKPVVRMVKFSGDNPMQAFRTWASTDGTSIAAQVIVSTDASAKPSKVLHPNANKVLDFGTPEANYIAGDINAFRNASAKTYIEAKGRGDIETANSALIERINEAEAKVKEYEGYLSNLEKEYAEAVAKRDAGTPVGKVDDRFDSWDNYLAHLDGHGKWQLETIAKYQAEADKWRSKLIKPAESPAPTEAPTPEPIGMGGAVASEFVPSQQGATSIKNAAVEADRAKMGLPPIVPALRKAWGAVWDEAMARIDRDPAAQDKLITELQADPRAATDVENAMLAHRLADLKNEYYKSTREMAQAHADGRTEDVALISRQVDDWSARVEQLTDLTRTVGSEQGRGLASRKMMVNEDLTLADMEMNFIADNRRAPTADERIKLQKDFDELQKVNAALEQSLTTKDQRIVELETQRAFDKAKADAAKEEPYAPRVIQIAERFAKYMDTKASDALARIKAKMAQPGAQSGPIDPTLLDDLAIVGAAKITRGAVNLAKWSDAMVRELGDWVKPHIDQVWDAAQKLFDNETGALEKTEGRHIAAQVRKKVTGTDKEKVVAAIGSRVKAGKLDRLQPLIQKLSMELVKEGVKTRAELVDGVHDILKEFIPNLTKYDTAKAISGYGDFRLLSKEEAAKTLRELKGQLQQQLKLEDMQGGKAPAKSGFERPEFSDEYRRLVKQVNEAKKKGGYKVTDPARQLRTAMQAVKTRLQNAIADLEHQIATRTKIVREKKSLEYDAEAKKLQARRDELKAQYDEIFEKPGLSDEQRLSMAMKSAERSIAEYERRIKSGDFKPKKRNVFSKSTPELDAARARRDALKEEYLTLKKLAEPKKSPEEIALQAWKSRTATRIAELEELIADGDFAPRKRKELKMDAEANDLRYKREQLMKKYNEGRLLDRLKNRTKLQKAVGLAAEILNTMRAVKTSFDFSAVLRQGGFVSFSHPIRASKSLGAMFKSFASERAQAEVMEEIYSRDNAVLYRRSGLYLSEQGVSLARMEEAYMSRFASKIPGVGASQRAYITFLNKLRADSFDAMVAGLTRDGTATLEEAKAISNYINKATGRGDLGTHEQAAVAASTIFFAPRYVASRFQMLAGQPLYGGTMRTRKLVAAEYARFLGAVAVIYGLAKLGGATVEEDPRSSDFGKIRFGDTRIDPLAGLQQVTVFSSRIATGETKNARGDVTAIRGDDVPYGKSKTGDVIWRFMRTKLSPGMGTFVDIAEGTDVIGKPVTVLPEEASFDAVEQSVAYRAVAPLSFGDIYQSMREHGIERGTALGLLSIFGAGVQTYEEGRR